MKEILALDKLGVLLGVGKAKRDYFLEGVEESVRVGELEVEFLDVEFVEVVEIVEDGLNSVQH